MINLIALTASMALPLLALAAEGLIETRLDKRPSGESLTRVQAPAEALRSQLFARNEE